ncbi:hypothetical protein R1flu_008816 [Riccia fluitans]|uniref:Uncharacterized protein n=1 Tax=Riccia fluitans TaxID=41844 RepID=A0ABD1Z1H8_9MARC
MGSEKTGKMEVLRPTRDRGFRETQRNDDDRSAKEAASGEGDNKRLQRKADKIVANGFNSFERRKVRRRGGSRRIMRGALQRLWRSILQEAKEDRTSNPSKKSDVPLLPTAGAEAPTPRKGKEKMAMQPENAFKDEVRKELRELKEAITMSRQEAEAIARSQKETTTRLGQSSASPSNHMEGTDVRTGQPAASLQTKSASMAEYRNTVARMLEECEQAVESLIHL